MKKYMPCLIIVFVLMCCGSLQAKAYTNGDVDADGQITAADARLTLRAAVKLDTLTFPQQKRADTDGDSDITAEDARTVLRRAVRLETVPAYSVPEEKLVDDSQQIYSYTHMADDLVKLEKYFPGLFHTSVIGTTADGREILAAVLGSGKASKQIVAEAGTHGREYLNPMALMSVAEYYLRNYDQVVYKGKTIRSILQDTDIVLIPMLNPDGISISQYGLNGLQTESVRNGVLSVYNSAYAAGRTTDSLETYLRQWTANANGVDLNRNFDVKPVTGSFTNRTRYPANSLYSAVPCSENETKAYVGLVNGLSNPVAVLSFHSQGKLLYWYCGQSAAGKLKARTLSNALASVSKYSLYGEFSFCCASADWTMIAKDIPSVTIETGKGVGDGNPLPYTQYAGIRSAIQDMFLAAAQLY